MTKRLSRALPAALFACFLGGCATLTTSSSQTVTVTTDPAGAACTFRREGQVVGVINPTPGSVMVVKSHSPLEVACVKEGYADATGTVGAKFQAMTFGNILFGGIVGIVVDAASGATAEYEPHISIQLTPGEFADLAARDRFFDQQRDSFITRVRQVRESIAASCRADECERRLQAAGEEEKSGLARIESQRQNAKIRKS